MTSDSRVDRFFDRIAGRQEIDIKQRMNSGDDRKIDGTHELFRDATGRYFIYVRPTLRRDAVLYKLAKFFGHDALKTTISDKLAKKREETRRGFIEDFPHLIPNNEIRNELENFVRPLHCLEQLTTKYIDEFADKLLINYNNVLSFHNNGFPEVDYDTLVAELEQKSRCGTGVSKYEILLNTVAYGEYQERMKESLELIRKKVPAAYHSKLTIYGGIYNEENIRSVAASLERKNISPKNSAFPLPRPLRRAGPVRSGVERWCRPHGAAQITMILDRGDPKS